MQELKKAKFYLDKLIESELSEKKHEMTIISLKIVNTMINKGVKIMLSKEKTKLLKNVISTMDSFQQDYGKIHYSVNIGSYPTDHRIIVRAYNYDENKSIEFVIDETNEAYLYALFEQKTKIVLGE